MNPPETAGLALLHRTFAVRLPPFACDGAPLAEVLQFVDEQSEFVIVTLLRDIIQPVTLRFDEKIPVGYVLHQLSEAHGLQLDHQPGLIVVSQALAPMQATLFADVRNLMTEGTYECGMPEQKGDWFVGVGKN